ncbi:MAG: PQQ-dependent dehydrogenase, methanol/ethanol family [Acidobacteria bacterium]|nr:PQQ-dependent dehydrogenase, methanol/ethanol family [Acidobacteriota bacterium]
MKPILFFLLALPGLAQHDASGRGRQLFLSFCSSCHGDTGKGGRGSDLTTGQWTHGGSDDQLLSSITKGIRGTEMPGFALPDADARALVGYMHELSGKTGAAFAGDMEAGRTAFFGAAGCSRCHMYGGRGGLLGPDLSGIGKQRRPAALRKAIEKPNADVRAGYKVAEVRTRQGPVIRGVARYEDTFSIIIMDAGEKLHLLSKADLASVQVKYESPMPWAKVSPETLDNLIAFLSAYPAERVGPGAWHPAAERNVTFERLKNSAREPWNWLHYWGDYEGTHYSGLKTITPDNVSRLASQWTWQFGAGHIETMPLLVDGIMYVTGPLSNVVALDARTGNPIWKYDRPLPKVAGHCTVMTNRGVAVLGDRVYLATLDARLVALNAKSGGVIFDVEVEDYRKGFSITHAPLAIDGKILVGITAGECALTGFVDAYDAATGKRLWRTHTVAQPGDPNTASWGGDSAKYGGAPTWMTGTYDAGANTIYWTTGNPGPDYNGTTRPGDNLYSSAVLALDAATGKRKWWFQFTPHDVHDWDGNQTPVLLDAEIRGQKRKLLATANRNAFYYVLDRTTGQFVAGKAFARQTWAKGLDDKGRPIVLPNTEPTPEGNYVCPDAAGAANWGAPSYDAATKLFYVSVRETCATYTRVDKVPVPGEGYTGGSAEVDPKIGEPGAVRALDVTTGNVKWNFPIHIGSYQTGNLATAGGVLFASSADGHLIALDSRTGKLLWNYQTGARIVSSPVAYAVDGRQYIAIASQSALFTFALPK